MNIKKVIFQSVVATSVMTAFSHWVAQQEKKNFSEAALLSSIEKKQLQLPGWLNKPAGWATHYAIGIVMAIMFEEYKKYARQCSALHQTVIFGTAGGLFAVVAWHQLFKTLPKRSADYYKKFYQQLFIAHLIFTAVIQASQKSTKE